MIKLLYVSNISGKRYSMSFSGTAIYAAQELGYEFHSVANRSASNEELIKQDEELYNIKLYHIDLQRAPYSLKNIKAYKQLCKIIRDEKIDYIHCNTPTGGLLARLAGKKCKVKKVIYQAHGFHFYKGAPKLNWLIYYPIEKFLARYTDAVVTINKEDYEFAKNKIKPRKNGPIYYVSGVGIDCEAFKNIEADRKEKREALGLKEDDIVCISMGDLIARKNYPAAIKAIAALQNPKLHYIICGKGPDLESLKALAKELNVENNIHFLGFRTDIRELSKISDIFIFTTLQEGMPRSMMEAMASSLPCIASNIRGNVDLIDEGKGGYLCSPNDISKITEALKVFSEDAELRQKMGAYNLEKVKQFSVSVVTEQLKEIYTKTFEE